MDNSPHDEPLFSENPILGGIERMLQRQIAASTAARKATRGLNGKSLALELTGINVTIFAHINDEHIALSTAFDEDADVIISGSPLAMLEFARTRDQDSFRSGGVKFTGDVGTAMDFQKLFGLMSPDLDEELSRLIGDEAAHRVGSTVRQLFSWSKTSLEKFGEGVSEYLTREQGDTPSEDELERFMDDVDRLRTDVDRAQAKFTRFVTKHQQD